MNICSIKMELGSIRKGFLLDKKWIFAQYYTNIAHSEISKTSGEKFSISVSLTIAICIPMTTSPQKIKIFGRGNQKLLKFKEFSLYDKQEKLNSLAWPYWIKLTGALG